MRDYTNFPDEVWVTGKTWIDYQLVRFVGFVVGYNDKTKRYQVSIPALGHESEDDFIEVQRYRLTVMGTDEEVKDQLINFTLDQGQEEWFMELTEKEEV